MRSVQISVLVFGLFGFLTLSNAYAQQGLQPVSKSRLTGIALPPGAQLITEAEMLSQINAQLDGVAQKLQAKCGVPEVLGWLGDQRQGMRSINLISSELKESGWNYEDQIAGSEGGSSLKLMYAEKQGRLVGGFWITGGEGVILAWCELTSTARTPQPVVPDRSTPPVAKALEGLYVGYYDSFTERSEYNRNLITAGSGPVKEHIIFFPDGEYFWRLPAYGLANFNREEQKKDFGWWWGRYTNDGQKLRLESPHANIVSQWTKEGLRIQERIYKRACTCDGMKISGTYHRPGWEQVDDRISDNYITFYPDGKFEENDFLYAAAINRDGHYGQADPTSGSGTYAISQNTLELRYTSGYITRVAFYVHREAENKRNPNPIVIGVYARWFRLKNS